MSKYPQQHQVGLFLEGCLAQMDTGRDWFATRVLPLSLDQLRWRSGIGAWSILECLNHLHHMFEHYVPGIEQAVRQNRPHPGRPVFGRLFAESEEEFLTQVEPPIGTAVTMLPLPGRVAAVSPERIVDQHSQLRFRYCATVRTASEMDLANTVVEGSIHPPVCSLGGIMALLAAYDRRHMWQAERVRRAAGFPAPIAGTRLEDDRQV